jgi:hypothetical protein
MRVTKFKITKWYLMARKVLEFVYGTSIREVKNKQKHTCNKLWNNVFEIKNMAVWLYVSGVKGGKEYVMWILSKELCVYLMNEGEDTQH